MAEKKGGRQILARPVGSHARTPRRGLLHASGAPAALACGPRLPAAPSRDREEARQWRREMAAVGGEENEGRARRQISWRIRGAAPAGLGVVTAGKEGGDGQRRPTGKREGAVTLQRRCGWDEKCEEVGGKRRKQRLDVVLPNRSWDPLVG